MQWKLILCVAAALCSSMASPQLTKVATPGSVPPPASVSDLAWLVGEVGPAKGSTPCFMRITRPRSADRCPAISMAPRTARRTSMSL